MPVRMKIMSDQKMREAFNSLIAKGHMIGFNDFQTGWEAREAIVREAVESERDANLLAIYAEHVEPITEEDEAYNMALRHADAAIRARGEKTV